MYLLPCASELGWILELVGEALRAESLRYLVDHPIFAQGFSFSFRHYPQSPAICSNLSFDTLTRVYRNSLWLVRLEQPQELYDFTCFVLQSSNRGPMAGEGLGVLR